MAGLASPLTVGVLQLKNRILMPPMATGLSDEEGGVTPELVAHYAARAGGPAMITVEHSVVTPAGRRTARQLSIAEDRFVPGLRHLATAIREGGSVAVIQLTHAGSRALSTLTGVAPAGPSNVRVPGDTEEPRPMTAAEIAAIPELFAAAASRALAAGFNGIQIHGAHGFLLSEFASPYTNRRTDAYGGDLEGRLRLIREVITAVREALGPSALLSYRFPAEDGVDGGLTTPDAAEIAPLLAEWGVDILDCSGGMCGSRPPGQVSQGYFIPAAAVVKSALAESAAQVPVAGVGGIRDPIFADRSIREGQVDAVSVGRAQLRDPDWARKALARLAG